MEDREKARNLPRQGEEKEIAEEVGKWIREKETTRKAEKEKGTVTE